MKNAALLLVALPLVACGSAVAQNATTTGSGGSGTTAAGTGVTGASTAASTSSGGDGKTVTLTMQPFDVPAGKEVYMCQNFANPFGGATVDIGEFESHMAKGSHHLLVFYKDGITDSPEETCSGLEFAATPYGSQQPDDTLSFPPGVAAELPPTTGLRFQSHYLNVTGQTIHATVQVTFHLVDPATVTAKASVLFMVQPNINIPPNTTQKVTYDCNLPQDMQIMRANSHMHSHGTNFTSTIAGQTFYDTTTWDEPQPEVYSPVMTAHQGDPLHFECTFVNNSSNTLTFGESAETNEMCILSASFYPAPAGQPTITCM